MVLLLLCADESVCVGSVLAYLHVLSLVFLSFLHFEEQQLLFFLPPLQGAPAASQVPVVAAIGELLGEALGEAEGSSSSAESSSSLPSPLPRPGPRYKSYDACILSTWPAVK